MDSQITWKVSLVKNSTKFKTLNTLRWIYRAGDGRWKPGQKILRPGRRDLLLFKCDFIHYKFWCYGFCQNGREPDELLPDLILATVSVIEMTNLATVPTNRNAFWQPSPKFRFF